MTPCIEPPSSTGAGANPLIQAALLGDAAEGAAFAVLVADEVMRYVAVNSHACRLLGYARVELELRVSDVAREADAGERYDSLMRDGVQIGETRLRTKDGGELAVRYLASETRVAGLPY